MPLLLLAGYGLVSAGGLVGLREVLKRSIRQARKEADEVVKATVEKLDDVVENHQRELEVSLIKFADGFAESVRAAFE